MGKKRDGVTTCGICGKSLYHGDAAYATTTGVIEESVGGFSASDTDPWLTVACKKCGLKISDLICGIDEWKTFLVTFEFRSGEHCQHFHHIFKAKTLSGAERQAKAYLNQGGNSEKDGDIYYYFGGETACTIEDVREVTSSELIEALLA